MKYFEVESDGSLLDKTDLTLAPEKVMIVVDEDEKRMWLWKGAQCPVKKKFVGSKSLSDLRKNNYGFAFVSQTCEQGDETAEFVAMIKKIGKTSEISEEVLAKASHMIERQRKMNVFEESLDDRPTTKALLDGVSADDDANLKQRPSQVQSAQLPIELAKMGTAGNRPTPSILTMLDGDQIATPTREAKPKPKEDDYKKSFSILKDLGVPKGFDRDLVIIAKKVFTETYDKKFEELDEPPEGVFFSKNHVPRMICENGVVLAIEFLKPQEGAQLDEEDEVMARDIDDLIDMFEIET